MSNSLFEWLWVTMSKFIKCSKTGSIYLFYYKKSYLKPEINKNPSKIKELECVCIIKYCCYDAYCQTTTKLWLATAKTCLLLTGMQVGQWSYGTAFSGDSSTAQGKFFSQCWQNQKTSESWGPTEAQLTTCFLACPSPIGQNKSHDHAHSHPQWTLTREER